MINFHTLKTDGAKKGDKGASYGFVIYDSDKKEVYKGYQYLFQQTCVVAEYSGIIMGLDKAIELGITHLHLRSDSQLAIEQINGNYKVTKEHLIPFVEIVKQQLSTFGQHITVKHIPREDNVMADALANHAYHCWFNKIKIK